jgi:hypothetical protein
MSNDTTHPSVIIDRSQLLPPLRRMFGSDDVTAVEWDQQSPTGIVGVSGAVVTRLTGTATVDGQLRPWSLIRKRLASPASRQADPSDQHETPSGSRYWKRELAFYQSGLLDELPEGFAAPRCFCAEEQTGGCTLWLEEIRDEIPIWPLDRYGIATRHLGLWNGFYLTQPAIPDYPWLTVGMIEQRAQIAADRLANLDELRQHPLVRRGWPDDVAQGILRIWQEREQFFRALRRLPPTLLHGDADRRNLMSRTGKKGEAETVAIDWGYVGVGAIGEEIAPTVVSTVFWFRGVTAAQLPELEEIVLDGYLQGLRQAGWRGDPQLARLGYLCAVALRYGPMIAIPEVLAMDQKNRDAMVQHFGWSIEEWTDTHK